MINFKSFLVKPVVFFFFGITVGISTLTLIPFLNFQKEYESKIFPGVILDNIDLAGKSESDVRRFFEEKNQPFKKLNIKLLASEQVTAVSAETLNIHFDDSFTFSQAFSFSRTGNKATDLLFKIRSFFYQKLKLQNPVVILTPVITYNYETISDNIYYLKQHVDLAPVDPLFEYDKNSQKVKAFRLGKEGFELSQIEAEEIVENQIKALASGFESLELEIALPVKKIMPNITSTEGENLGINSLLGSGYSIYKGSIAGRIHNLTLAAGILHGKLVLPGGTFSFNKEVGDISASTGYKPAYVIKSGRTILDDGGGVCQVSTTLFRAVLNAGLPISERSPHSYRVSYYELGGFKPGVDATVFAPSTDFKFINDTSSYILIQTKIIPSEYRLEFELYGTSDGRKSEVYNFKLWDQKPPPPPLYQDDLTLPLGTEKQVDWPAWGAKSSFDYKVTRNGEILFEKTYYSNYQPWQAVYLRGTKIN